MAICPTSPSSATTPQMLHNSSTPKKRNLALESAVQQQSLVGGILKVGDALDFKKVRPELRRIGRATGQYYRVSEMVFGTKPHHGIIGLFQMGFRDWYIEA